MLLEEAALFWCVSFWIVEAAMCDLSFPIQVDRVVALCGGRLSVEYAWDSSAV
jgi:hypothetical protein